MFFEAYLISTPIFTVAYSVEFAPLTTIAVVKQLLYFTDETESSHPFLFALSKNKLHQVVKKGKIALQFDFILPKGSWIMQNCKRVAMSAFLPRNFQCIVHKYIGFCWLWNYQKRTKSEQENESPPKDETFRIVC